jgi:prepilin-type N-terminal cleavage/methylation domain-containing protein
MKKKHRRAVDIPASRPGFSLMELIIVLALIAIVSAMLLPAIGRTVGEVRLQHSATVVASNLQLARSLAARQRSPVRLSIDSAQKVMRVRNYTNPATVYAEYRFDRTSENAVSRLEVKDTSLVIYPNGLAADEIWIRLITLDDRRVVRMTRAGQIRIEQ